MDGNWNRWWVILLVPFVMVQAGWKKVTGWWQRRRRR